MTPNDLQLLKRALFLRADVSAAVTRSDVTVLINEANQAAYDSLEDDDKRHVSSAVKMLRANMNGSFGELCALELLAAVAQVMGGDNGKK